MRIKTKAEYAKRFEENGCWIRREKTHLISKKNKIRSKRR
jgi:hypothetical protein